MEDHSSRRLIGYLPQVLVATFVVAVCPVLLLGVLSAAGVLRSLTLSVGVAIAWSSLAAWAGGHYWRSRPRSGDVVFGDLMLWGWVRRLLSERRVHSTLALLEGVDSHGGATLQQRRELLLDLAAALEAGDPYTSGHSRRVARYAEEIAKGMGLSPRQVAKVRTAAALHDVGKVRTPTAILHKPDRLTDVEFEVIKAHPVDGAEMVAALGDRELTAIIRHHHERLDGTGYPAGLAREAIPLGARIIAVADTFDAVTSVRPYRGATAHKRALDILTHEAGTQLDPGAVRAFQRYYTGSRPLAIWVSGTTAAQRIAALLGGGVGTATASVTRIVLAAAVSSSAAAAVALVIPAIRAAHVESHRTPAAVSPAALTDRPAAGAVSLTTRSRASKSLPGRGAARAHHTVSHHVPRRRHASGAGTGTSTTRATSAGATRAPGSAGQLPASAAAGGSGGGSGDIRSGAGQRSAASGHSHASQGSRGTPGSAASGSQGAGAGHGANPGDGSGVGRPAGSASGTAQPGGSGSGTAQPSGSGSSTAQQPPTSTGSNPAVQRQSTAPAPTGDQAPAGSGSHGN